MNLAERLAAARARSTPASPASAVASPTTPVDPETEPSTQASEAAPAPPQAPESTPAAAPQPSAPVAEAVVTAAPTGLAQRIAPAAATAPQTGALSKLREEAVEQLFQRLGSRLTDAEIDDDQLQAMVTTELGQVVEASRVPLTAIERQRLVREVLADVLGLGPLEPFLADPSVTEIMVNGPHSIYIERAGQLHRVPTTLNDEAHLRRIIDRIVSRVGRRIDESSPVVDARLADGSRVNAIIPPLAVSGSTLTIRKFAHDAMSVRDLVSIGTFTPEMAELLAACVRARLNVIISGGTGTGKTTLLNVLSSFIPNSERIITIEDAVELKIQQEHVVRLESRPPNTEGKGEITIRDLVRNALRMRPDRIVVGEVRGAEALDMLQAMNTGHDGSLSTVHANSPRDALSRLETLVLMAGMELPLRAIREQIAAAVDVVVHLARLRDGTRRVIGLTEVHGMEGQTVTLQDIFAFDFTAGVDEYGRFRGRPLPTGVRPQFADRFAELGIQLSPRVFGGDPWSPR